MVVMPALFMVLLYAFAEWCAIWPLGGVFRILVGVVEVCFA
jgi:hypothetical protein